MKPSLSVSCLAALSPGASLLPAGTGSGQPRHASATPQGSALGWESSACDWGGREHGGLQLWLGQPHEMALSLVAPRAQELWLLSLSCAALR